MADSTSTDVATSPPSPRGPVPGQVVPRNRWDRLQVPALGAWTPTRRLSVVLPHYQATAELENTLAALAHQTYPAELVQVIVADDGSSPPLRLPARHRGLDLMVVYQEDQGFGLARARNLGAAVAGGDILVFLDGDMVPEPRQLEAHARWHHACQHALTLGFRRHVAFDGIGPDEVAAAARSGSLAPLFDGRPVSTPGWLERHMTRMTELTADHDDLFRATTGGNLGVRAETFHAVGGCDATFTQWGSEDTDLGHRLFLAGAVLIPEREAVCWHQGDSGGLEAHERRSLEQQRARLSQLVPHPGFRRTAPGRSFTVPRILVVLDAARRPHATVTATLESVLASDLHDLEVLLEVPSAHPDRVRLLREWAGDPRVVDAERAEHARTPYRMFLPAGTLLGPRALDEIVAAMKDPDAPTGVLHVRLPEAATDARTDGEHAGEVVVVSTRALGRARAIGADDERTVAAALFGERALDGARLGVSWAPVTTLQRIGRPAAVAPPEARPHGSLDAPVRWVPRQAVERLLTEADTQLDVAHHETAVARHDAEVARHELERLRNRRAVRAALEVAGTRDRHDAWSLPARLRASTTPRPEPAPPPVAPPAQAPPRRTDATDDLDVRLALQQLDSPPPPAVRPTPFPHLRVLHLGTTGRFLDLAEHTTVDPDTWREQLRGGADLLLIEPPRDADGWDPLGGDLAALLHTAEELGIPSVRLASTSTAAGPGRARLDLVEGPPVRPDPLAPGGRAGRGPTGDRIAPSVDTGLFNPMGWFRQPPDPVLAVLARVPDPDTATFLAAFDPPPVLGHASELPVGDDLGIRRSLASPQQLRRALIRAGVLLDHPAWRGDATETLRLWTASLACGTPVVVVDDVAASTGELGLPDGGSVPLPPGVLATRAADAPETVHAILVDTDRRERLGIVGRRVALRDGSRETVLRRILEEVDVAVPAPPRTTVLLATHRPDFLERGLASVARQTQAGVDVALVLHGPAFDDVDVPDRGGPSVSSVIRAPQRWVLGDCLNAALDRAGGELVAKMDDDDHYGPEHLRDLVTAWGYSGADIVGKRVEYVHLVERDLTIRRPTSPSERDRAHVGGPTLLGSRETLRQHRFLRLPNRVDSTLYERVLAAGGRVYGIHSRDLVLERHGHGHAWSVDDASFLAEAIDQRPGLDLSLASSDPDCA